MIELKSLNLLFYNKCNKYIHDLKYLKIFNILIIIINFKININNLLLNIFN